MGSPHGYAQLLSPGRIGPLELRNRILMTPMGTNQERGDGHLGEAILDYYEARARGGVGLVIAGVAAITWPEGACNPNQAALSDERFLDDWLPKHYDRDSTFSTRFDVMMVGLEIWVRRD